MSPKVPEDYREARRQQILTAAAECFLEKGFHRTTMQDIFDASGLSAGAVYNYFEGKDEIVAAMGEVSQARNTAMASRAPSPDDEMPMATVLESFLAMLRTPEAAKWAAFDMETFAEAARNETIRKSIRENLRQTTDVLIPLVEQQQAAGVYSAELDPRAIVTAIALLVQGVQNLRVVDPEADPDAYLDVCLAIADGSFFTGARADTKTEEA